MRRKYKNSVEKQKNNQEQNIQQSQKHIRLSQRSTVQRSKSPTSNFFPLTKILLEKENNDKINDKNNDIIFNTRQKETKNNSSTYIPDSKKGLSFIPKFIKNANNSTYCNTEKNLANPNNFHVLNQKKEIKNKKNTYTNVSEIEIDLNSKDSINSNKNNNESRNGALKKERITSFVSYRKKIPINNPVINNKNKSNNHIIKIENNDKNNEKLLNSEKSKRKKINFFIISKEQVTKNQVIKNENNNEKNKNANDIENKSKILDKDNKNLFETRNVNRSKHKNKIISLLPNTNKNNENANTHIKNKYNNLKNNNDNNKNIETNDDINNISNLNSINSIYYIKKNKIPSNKNTNFNNNIQNLNNKNIKENRETEKTKIRPTLLYTQKPTKSFKFLIHQASKDKELSNSFHKYYGKKSPRLSGLPEESIIEKMNLKTENNNNITDIYDGNLPINFHKRNLCLIKSPKPISDAINILSRKKNNIGNNNNESNNIKAINYASIKDLDKDQKYTNIRESGEFNNVKTPLTEKKNENNISDKYVVKYYKIPNNNTPLTTHISSELIIDVNLFIFFGEKISVIVNKITNYQLCEEDCQSYLSWYFANNFHENEINLFQNIYNKQEMMVYLKLELLCFFLLIDISFNNSFTQASILLRTIFNLIYFNYMILLNFITQLYFTNQIKIKGDIKTMKNIVDNYDKYEKIYNENQIISKITQSFNSLSTYYKILVESLYFPYNIIKDDEDKFPNCIREKNNKSNKYSLINILSSFFIEGLKSFENYDFNDLKIFFELYFNNHKNKINSNFSNNFGIICFLPKIKNFYQFSLILDLDETLISMQKNNFELSENDNKLENLVKINLIYRPGLLDFLRNMKQIYELILFSSGTINYVKAVVRHIEKDEKFFEYVLYRKYMSFDENGRSFKNLDYLNRNLKNVIIVDNMAKNFKLHKRNGICIKPFKGDVINDKNTLFFLTQILQRIRYDANYSGDIRVSLSKEKKSNLYSQIAIE